jgi:hypothetical protein
MPKKKATFKIPEDEDLTAKAEGFIDKGGIAEATKAKRKSVENRFGEFVLDYKGMSFDTLVQNALESSEGRKELQQVLMAFFTSMKIDTDLDENGEALPPMKNTCEGYKSHLRMIILGKSDGKLDTSNPVMFKTYQVIFI